ncbi:MAG: DUF4339 domain-containing protein [Kiritimatiellaeota bacterium]|nr:DUF4339 domain-containing protein [Kiritimatiellota bacterium]
MANWYVLRGETVTGPFDRQDLERMAASGKLLPADPVTSDEYRAWYRAQDVVGAAFPGADTAAGAPPEPLHVSVPVPLPPPPPPPRPAVRETPPRTEGPSNPVKAPRFIEIDRADVQYSEPPGGATEIGLRPQFGVDWKEVAKRVALAAAVLVVLAVVAWAAWHASNAQ